MKCTKPDKQAVTVTGLLSEITYEICENYCKYPEVSKGKVKDEDAAEDWLYDHYCVDCPLNKI